MNPSTRRPEAGQQETFWKQLIASGPEPFELPTDESRLPSPSFLRERASFSLPAAQWARVDALAAESHADPFTVVLAAIALVASRHARREDLWVGTVTFVSGGDAAGSSNLLALRLRIPGDSSVRAFLANVQTTIATAADNRDVPYAKVAAIAGAQPLFRLLTLPLGVRAKAWDSSSQPDPKDLGPGAASCDLVFEVVATGQGVEFNIEYDSELFRPATIVRLMEQTGVVLAAMVAAPDAHLQAVALMSESERQSLVDDWNGTDTPYDRNACVHQLVEQQAARTPDATALVCADRELNYAELNAHANRLAHLLIKKGVGPDVAVGVCVERSHLLPVAALAVQKAGGAYLPMDPSYPPKRIAHMIEDSGVQLVLADSTSSAALAGSAEVLRLDASPEADEPDSNPSREIPSQSLAYIIYTSGSTGNPKGVMVEHRNVANFFAGMDQKFGTRPGSWLAVTSLSFDISVLELFWTLSRGYKVVLYSSHIATSEAPARDTPGNDVDFGLFYFASDEGDYAKAKGREKYKLLLEGAKFADEHGFCAVWTPERHFHTFGGMFPSPSVAAGALAMITKRISIRAGSVVLPLHNPVRVTEEWSLVDNLSDGRVEISFASGWQPQDFVMAPEAFPDRQKRMYEGIETVRALWRGETRESPGGDGKPVTFGTRPRPMQPELPVWVTAGGSPETFRRAGEIGANVLTHLLQQSIEQLGERLAVYRKAWQEHGHPGESGRVSLMVHTFVSHSEAHVRAVVHEPFKSYLKGAVGLFAAVAPKGLDLKTLSSEELDALAEHAFERYFESSGLFGTPESCAAMVSSLKRTGITELACLIDFGIAVDTVLASLPFLDELRRRFAAADVAGEQTIDTLIRRNGVTHLQCTPSMASILLRDPETALALAGLERMLVGGEALSEPLAAELKRALPRGTLTNMYGPTETTIWSMTHDVDLQPGPVPIGRPIANTQVHVLDAALNPVPIGMAGELYIGGDGVARGYFKRSALTHERFIGDPFRNGHRLYKTGDLARRRPDGTIEFLGRMDDQAKVRGFRIELGEIESVLAEHPDVRQAAVYLWDVKANDVRIVACCVPANKGRMSPIALRKHLRGRLPEYMIPQHFLQIEEIPLTPNGKIDRKMLPKPAVAESASQRQEAPSDPVEAEIAEIWTRLIGPDRPIGRSDKFFEMGGHSLLGLQALRQIEQKFGVKIAFPVLFRENLAEIAAKCRRAS